MDQLSLTVSLLAVKSRGVCKNNMIGGD